MYSYDPAARGPERGPLWTVATVLIILAVIACGTGLIIGVPMYEQYPAHVTLPAGVLGDLTLLPGATESLVPDESVRPAGVRLIEPDILGVYGDDKNSQRIAVVAAARFLLFPESEVDTAIADQVRMNSVAGEALEIGEIVEVPAGDLGGSTKCAYYRYTARGTRRGVVCGWADHGSVGIVALAPAEDRDDAARMFLDIRSAIESH